ncbi:hypothetical protein NBZ79_04520 [Sneathiella marina]|uniref:Lipocalin-like domain-containing protein n=1 Tax=Sneathiella marina TaxID=2950108 RepID=A0ABY4W4W8_9PROT|nr:hypothetical protein [Sneathiella marina]USG62240.1 hypothetical protein NBZ79_04520 [Sneathiella marina]
MARIKIFMAIALFIVVLPAISSANDVPISAFKGDWRGNAISENNVSVNFPITSRDIDVDIRPDASGGFNITWRTLLRQKGNPASPNEVLKETTLTFVNTDKPGVWKDSKGGDVYAGDTVSWAQIRKQTLTIYVMAMSDTGDYDMQVYKRTLTGLNMELDFTAIRDGAVRRTAKGRLILHSK